MKNKEHPYAHILRAIADGKDVQWERKKGEWHFQSADTNLKEISTRVFPVGHYRIAPQTININGHEVPEPMRVAPEPGASYWLPEISQDPLVTKAAWWGDACDRQWLAKGMCHATEEAALAHGKALLSFTATK